MDNLFLVDVKLVYFTLDEKSIARQYPSSWYLEKVLR